MSIVEGLITAGKLKNPLIIEAFRKVDRKHFLPDNVKSYAEVNQAVPIGYDQTNSQPLVVALMLELLEPVAENTILDIGSGSGWTTALLAEIVGPKGKVVAIEILPELFAFGKKNIEALGYENVEFRQGDWYKEIKDSERFDRIQAACAMPSVPAKLEDALNPRGRLLIPIEYSKWGDQALKLIWKHHDGTSEDRIYPGFQFVPMTTR